MYTKTLVAFLSLIFIAGTGTILLQKEFSQYLARKADKEFSAGNYLASLVGFKKAEERVLLGGALEVQQKIKESKELLVAEVNFEKAKKAAEEGDWLEAKALLAGDPAMINTTFLHYQEAIDLFLEASEKVKVLEEIIDSELKKLKTEAAIEKERRESAEGKILQTQTQLQSTIAEKTKTEEVLRSEIEQKASEVEKVKAEVEVERLKKFKNELDVYVSMLVKGDGYLASALSEIEKENESTLLVVGIIELGKGLFDEANIRGEDMLAERTPDNLKTHVQKLLQATALLSDVSKKMGSLVYVGKENESEFQNLKQEITERRNTATQLTQELQNFVQ
ncbi:MAG: hypothetical protein HYT27_00295 [Parcubacteria group bacterium]|nr:hypothetical protein [Parcubacteria group bacterium]